MDKQNINLGKTLDSEKLKSTSELVSSRVCDTHLRNCGHKYSNICICDHLIKLAKAHDKQLTKSCQNISQSSDSFHSIILAGSEHCFSQKSSENSFHSAKSIVSTTKLPITDYAENLSENNTESSKEVKNSLVESRSSHDVLNTNINENEKCKVSVRDDPSEPSDIYLNKAQDLFESTSTNDLNTDDNIDSINTSNSLSNDENLHFLLDNQSTTIYHEIPQFIKSYSALLHNEGNDTFKEVTRRLTRSFYKDPQEFAKRLMTIIEEPETNYSLECSAISVDKLTAAFLKMCKYVEDESMPSMCDKSLLDRNESTQLPYIHMNQDNPTDHSLSQETSTPIHPSKVGKKLSYKISPFSKKKNTSITRNSPLYISTLTRVTGSPKTPITLESSSFTPGSAQNLNDSSFTFWEKKCEARPFGINDSSVPILTDDEIKRFAKSQEQLRLLQAVDSNTRLEVPLDDDENDITESILYELAEKRKRCFETEKTIRQIDAESSAHSNSTCTSENEESVKILKYLTTLKDGADYQKFLMNDKIELSQQHCHDSKIDNRSLSQSPQTCRHESKKPVNECSSHSIMIQSNLQHNITERKKPLKISTPRGKSLDVNILKIGLSGHNSGSSKSNTDIKSPALMARRIVSPNSVSRSISKIDTPSVNESIPPLLSQTKKIPRSLQPSTHTPREKSPNFKIYSLNSYKSNSRLCSKIRAPSSVTTSSSSNAQTTPKKLNATKFLTNRKSTTQLLTSNKGFTLEYMDSISHSRSPHVRNHGTLSKTTKSQIKNKHCSNFCLTLSAPSETVCKKTQYNEILKEKNPNTPMSSGPNKGGKFFNTPGKTPIPKIRPKPTSYFSDNIKKPIFKSQYIDRYYNLSEVKSPVAEYIYGTDTTLIQNIYGKKNENLLTPKKKKEFSEQLEFKLTAKKNMENKPKKYHIFDYKVESMNDVNDENINDPRYNHPKVSYQLPNVIQEIRADIDTRCGSRARRLMEANDSRIIIKHAGRAKPQIHDVTQLDTSIHIPKSAEKQKFVFQTNYSEHH
ncbi:hypothetical protein PV327_005025 [Microctonus hyperodae]|uniref:Uncharacterized protein n=1 Tax=Microctonus hyperodae TaxID=165561 RepID=A0AA39FDN9_MICHY|nr:hypothetical protein PV327_005025 [Microctonus hyperodae]